jgi:hypothetical protein
MQASGKNQDVILHTCHAYPGTSHQSMDHQPYENTSRESRIEAAYSHVHVTSVAINIF